jgi:protein-S-isoprenylcysteine O-methyltransferase Ste14
VAKHKHFIDSHKCATGLAVAAMIAAYDAWDNPTALVYLALHGTYGVLWAVKSAVFGDRQWEREVGLGEGLTAWAALTLYWIAPWIIVAYDVRAPAWHLGLAVAAWGVGILLHFASDMQKHMHLELAPGTLLNRGLWSRCRNPNYLGELLIYVSFASLARHWIPIAWLATFVLGYWVPNMLRKDRSLARYPEFAAWKERSWLFIPPLV